MLNHIKRLLRWRNRAADAPRANVAFHEAAHAVAVVLLKGVLISATIRPTETDEGRVHEITPTKKKIIVALSGPAAETYFLGYAPDEGDSGDHRQAAQLALRCCATRAEAHALLDRAADVADALCRLHWDAIKHVAAALLARETLTGAEVHALVRPHM